MSAGVYLDGHCTDACHQSIYMYTAIPIRALRAVGTLTMQSWQSAISQFHGQAVQKILMAWKIKQNQFHRLNSPCTFLWCEHGICSQHGFGFTVYCCAELFVCADALLVHLSSFAHLILKPLELIIRAFPP